MSSLVHDSDRNPDAELRRFGMRATNQLVGVLQTQRHVESFAASRPAPSGSDEPSSSGY